jgi:hypothetical protein
MIRLYVGSFKDYYTSTEKYVTEICFVIQDFGNRFCDFQRIRTVVAYLSFPFKSDLNIKETLKEISN